MTGVLQMLLAGFGGAATDEYFEYVTMLLPGNGTNGAQNNTFLDSSTNNFTITRNGNTTQGTFTPYGSNWSNYFDGSGDYLTVPSNTALNLGSGDFTIEVFWYPTAFSTDDALVMMGTSAGSFCFALYNNSTGGGVIALAGTGGGSWDILGGLTVGTAVLNQWNHVVLVRSGTTFSTYMNGVRGGTQTSSSSLGSADLGIAANSTGGSMLSAGYLSNLRILKGTALYSGTTLTVPTSPLTAITNTSLLTCQSNRFIDNSSNNFTITRNGDVSVQRFSPFNPTTPYAAGTIGGSGYFDGTGDTLTTSSTQIIPTGSFTVECWAYVTGSGTNQKFVSQGSSGAAGRFSVGIEGGNWFTQIAGALIQTGTPVRNQWNYIAVTYNGSTLTMYVNGSSIGTASTSGNVQNSSLTIGQDWNSYITTGYIAEVRISSTVRTISVPTTPYTSDGSTSFLCSFTNGGIIDNAMMNDLETVGNAQISTSVSKFGGGSLAFDGTGDRLQAPASLNSVFGTGDFTVECWLYVASNPAQYTCVVANWAGADPSWLLDFATAGGILRFNDNTNVYLTASSAVTTSQWNHIAVSRAGTSLKMFINGVQVASATNSTSFGSASAVVTVGGYYDNTYVLNGYIDDLRITKGYARYTANFTPPTQAFPLQ